MFCNGLDDPEDVFESFKFLRSDGTASRSGFMGGVSAQTVVVLLQRVVKVVKGYSCTCPSTTCGKGGEKETQN